MSQVNIAMLIADGEPRITLHVTHTEKVLDHITRLAQREVPGCQVWVQDTSASACCDVHPRDRALVVVQRGTYGVSLTRRECEPRNHSAARAKLRRLARRAA